MAVSSSTTPTPPSPPLPWKRIAQTPLLAAKRSKEGAAADEGLVSEPWRRELAFPSAAGGGAAGGDEQPAGAVYFSGGAAQSKDGDRDVRPWNWKDAAAVRGRLAGAGGESKVGGCPRVRRRPAKIDIPENDVVLSGFGDVGKVESDGEFRAEGSCYGIASKRGNRRVMEDGYGVIVDIEGDAKQAYFAVFDGHGGRAAVDYASEKLGTNILAALSEQEPRTAIREGYRATDKEFLDQGVGGGACAATVLLKGGELHAANAGDCRVVMSRKGVATALTADHRPEREDERARIENSGGYVSCHSGIWRVQGCLAVSRAIGDLHVKDWIISEPETTSLRLASDCEFLIMASDGLWDKVSNQEAVDVIAAQKNISRSCKKLVDMSCGRGSTDDITVMIVDLQRFVQDD